MNALTPRQSEILAFIQETLETTGMPPTRAEIARALGFRSANAAEGHLKALARKGAIELIPGSSRGIRLLARISHHPTAANADPLAVTGRTPCRRLDVVSTTPATPSGPCPPSQRHLDALASRGGEKCGLKESGLAVVGQVAAGSPILAEQHIETHYPLDPGLFTPPADYLLRVRGMSMCEAGILDGDLLAVHRTQDIHNGQIVVARLEDEVTVKRFKRQGHKVWLLPENANFEPIEIDLTQQTLEIEGIGVGVLRNGRPL